MASPKETIHLGQLEIRLLFDADDTDGQLLMFEFRVPGSIGPARIAAIMPRHGLQPAPAGARLAAT